MQIHELNNYTKLFDAYGKLLSNKQYEVMDKFLNMDISESEMAELENGSRQAIHDAISKAKKQLVEFESKCHFVERNEILREKLEELKQVLDSNQADIVDTIITNL